MSGDKNLENNIENNQDPNNTNKLIDCGYGIKPNLKATISTTAPVEKPYVPYYQNENQYQTGVYTYQKNPFQPKPNAQQPHIEQQPARQNNYQKRLNTSIEQHHSPQLTESQNHQTWYNVSGNYNYSFGNRLGAGNVTAWFKTQSVMDGTTINTRITPSSSNPHYDYIKATFHTGDKYHKPYFDALIHRLGTNNDARNWYQVKIPAHINITKPPSNYYR